MDVSLIVAVFNEESVILDNLNSMVAALSTRASVDWEIICVDDGSLDKSGEIMDEFAKQHSRVSVLHHRRNFGQGRALRSAFEECQGDIIVTIDADLSYGVEYIYRLADVVRNDNVEIALASAYMKGGSVHNIPLHRYILSRLGNYYLSKLSQYSISTSTCVVRAYHKEVIKDIVFLSDGMELQLEILAKAHMMGFDVKEIPAKLEWLTPKINGSKSTRKSKMSKARSIKLYLAMGWLFKPALLFFSIATVLLLAGSYLLFNNVTRYFILVKENMGEGLLTSLSISLKELLLQYPHTVIFCTMFLLFGGLTLAFSLILTQNKFYHEELFKLSQMSMSKKNKQE